jgi:hypothetical protein
MECLALIFAYEEFYTPAFVGPDGMGDLVHDIKTTFD